MSVQAEIRLLAAYSKISLGGQPETPCIAELGLWSSDPTLPLKLLTVRKHCVSVTHVTPLQTLWYPLIGFLNTFTKIHTHTKSCNDRCPFCFIASFCHPLVKLVVCIYSVTLLSCGRFVSFAAVAEHPGIFIWLVTKVA